MSNSHEGHRITYNEDALCEYTIVSIDAERGVVEFAVQSQQTIDVREKFLHCEECDERLEPHELGLDADWLPVDVASLI